MKISDMVGRTFTAIEGAENGSGEIVFRENNGALWTFSHSQNCCESVSVEDVSGDVFDLLNEPLTTAEEATSADGADTVVLENVTVPEHSGDSYTWTFYRFATAKGWVVIRWLGESNGYYSEGVSLDYTSPLPRLMS